jgi:hypothetical protein
MFKKTKLNPELLKEELKRFKVLESYDFYQESKEEPKYDEGLYEAEDEETNDELPPTDNETDSDIDMDVAGEIGDELGLDADPEAPVGEMPEPEPETPDELGEPMEEPMEEPVDDEVEIDVTSLVQGSEEAKSAAEEASKNSEMLLSKLSDLENRIAKMDAVSNKIENLEKEIIKRNPTPVEKLEMRSLDSFPYSQKLTDYWKDKEGAYDVMGNEETKKKEYILKKSDVDYSYSEPNIKKSFGFDDNQFDEEDDNEF